MNPIFYLFLGLGFGILPIAGILIGRVCYMSKIADAVNYWKNRADKESARANDAEARATAAGVAETAASATIASLQAALDAANSRAVAAESKLSDEEKIAILPDAADLAALVIPDDAPAAPADVVPPVDATPPA